jgi:hypothetical protein
MHNVAEATVKELAESIAQRLEDALRKEGTPPEKKTSR